MEISSLPDEIVAQIFRHLPLLDQFRAGRVSRQFRRISILEISEIEELNVTFFLDLRRNIHRRLSNDGLKKLFELCSKNLQKLTLGAIWRKHSSVEIFSQFFCPKLTTLTVHYIGEKDADLGKILANCPNLEILVWHSCDDVIQTKKPIIFPSGLIDNESWQLVDEVISTAKPIIFPDGPIENEKLRKLDIGPCSQASIRSLVDKWPNLKTLQVDKFENSCSSQIWDQVFSAHSKLESIQFSNLEKASHCVKSLVALKDLQKFILTFENSSAINNDYDMDEAVLEMAIGCQNLQVIYMPDFMPSEETFLDLIRNCTSLKQIELAGVQTVDTWADAADIIDSLYDLGPREIDITFAINTLLDPQGHDRLNVWNSDEVRDVLEDLEMEGVKIKLYAFDRF